MLRFDPETRYFLLWCAERRISRSANKLSMIPGHFRSISSELRTVARDLLGGELFGHQQTMHALTADEDIYRGWLTVPDNAMWREVLRGKGEFPSTPGAEVGAHLSAWFERLRRDDRTSG